MVRVKKRASKRVGTAQREKIKRKINEHHRKSRKDAKKDVTWKSKLKKDPGIPNSYPFKEQLLNEIERKRELEEMEKIRLKEEKKSKKNGNQDHEQDEEEEDNEQDGDDDDQLAMQEDEENLGLQQDKDEPDDVPEIVMYQESLDDLIKDQDIHTLVHILDARDPILSLIPNLINKSNQNGKNLLVAITRSELLPVEALSNLITYLSIQTKLSPDQFFPLVLTPPSATNQKAAREHLLKCGGFPGVSDLVERIKELTVTRLEGLKKNQKKSKDQDEEDDLEVGAVAVVGIENSGRTSVANSISSCLKNTSEEESSPLDDLLVFDTPSILSPFKPLLEADDEDDEEEEQDEEILTEQKKAQAEIESSRILFRNQGSLNKIKDPLPLVEQIIARLANPTDLMLIYNTPAFGNFSSASSSSQSSKEQKREEVQNNTKEFLIGLARNRGRMSGKGIPDWWGSSRILLKDWSDGSIGYYTNLTPSEMKDEDETKFKQQSKEIKDRLLQDESFKQSLLSRKEWRKITEVGKKELRLKVVRDQEEKPRTSRMDEKVEIYFRKLREDEKLNVEDDEDEEGWEETEMSIDDQEEDQVEDEDADLVMDDEDDEEEEEANTSNLKSILKSTGKKSSKNKGSKESKSKKSVTLGGSTSSSDSGTSAKKQGQAKGRKVIQEINQSQIQEEKPVSKKQKRKSIESTISESEPSNSSSAKKVKGEKKREKTIVDKPKVGKKVVEKKTSTKTTSTPQVKGPAPGEKYDLNQFF